MLFCTHVLAEDNVYKSTRQYKGQEYQIILPISHFADRTAYDPNKQNLPAPLTQLIATAKKQMTYIEPDTVTWQAFHVELVRSKVGARSYWYLRIGLASDRGGEFVTCLTPHGEPAKLVKVTRTRLN
jgi:hypothetical protein